MLKQIDELTLARLCSEKNPTGENELYTRYAAKLLTLCRRYLPDDEANDLMQETLIKALEKIDSFRYRGEGSLYAWISRIAVNLALNQLKRNKHIYISLNFGHDDYPEPTERDIIKIPEDVLIGMISTLPEARRMVFNLYCIDGYSHKEVAEMLGISEKASASTLAKAKRQLKKEINDYLKNLDEYETMG